MKEFKQKKTSKLKEISFRVICCMIILLFLLSIITFNTASAESGPKTVSGRVYRSNGELVDSEYNGIDVVLYIEHDGKETPYSDLNGLENGWYSITIDAGGWSQGDIYWIEVDGSSWGDVYGRAEDRNKSGVTEWRMVGPGSHQLDVRTVAPFEEVEEREVNLEPELALFSGLAIFIIGLYLVGPGRKVDMDVIVLSRRLRSSSGSSGDSRNYIYEFGYGDSSDPIPIGRMSDLDEHLSDNSVVKVRVRGILSKPSGNYTWYKPELIGLERTGGTPSLAPDSEDDMDRLWYAAGGVKLDRGQSPESCIRSSFLKDISVMVIPFVLIEFIIGIYSYIFGWPIIPPLVGEALLLNLVILLLGIAGPLRDAGVGNRIKNQVENSKKNRYTVRQWAVLTQGAGPSEQSEANRLDFCGSCAVKVAQNAARCPQCGKDFVSHIEITENEARNILKRSAPETTAPPSGTSTPALPAQTAGEPQKPAQPPPLPPKT